MDRFLASVLVSSTSKISYSINVAHLLTLAASFATLRSVITVELLGLEKLTSAFGLLLLFQGLAVTIGSPIAGEILT